MIIGAVGEQLFTEREHWPRRLQYRSCGITILDIGRVRFEQQAAPIGIDQGVALAAFDLLAGVIASWPSALGRLDALTVDDGRRWTGFSTDPLAIRHHQCVVDLLEQAGIAKDREPVEHCALRRKLPRQKTPGDAATQDIEDRVHNFAHAPFMRSPPRRRSREEGRGDCPLLIR